MDSRVQITNFNSCHELARAHATVTYEENHYQVPSTVVSSFFCFPLVNYFLTDVFTILKGIGNLLVLGVNLVMPIVFRARLEMFSKTTKLDVLEWCSQKVDSLGSYSALATESLNNRGVENSNQVFRRSESQLRQAVHRRFTKGDLDAIYYGAQMSWVHHKILNISLRVERPLNVVEGVDLLNSTDHQF